MIQMIKYMLEVQDNHWQNVGRNIKGRTTFKHTFACCHIILIEEYDVNNREEQLRLERKHYDLLKSFIVNCAVPIFLNDEEKHSARLKSNLKYRNSHKELAHAYYEKHKAVTWMENKTKRTCICGSAFGVHKAERHNRTPKHTDFMNRVLGNIFKSYGRNSCKKKPRLN